MIKGCTTSTACNYNSEAKEDDNSCIDPLGCNDWCPGDTTEVKELDCAGVCGGIQFIDCSDQCGLLVVDDCGVCGGNNAMCIDCNGVVNGGAAFDKCGDCAGGNTGLEACTYDCYGYWGGNASEDECGVCNGDNSTCTDCNGVINGTAAIDGCGDCVIAGDECTYDCEGILGGSHIIDDCDVCVLEGDTSCLQSCDGSWTNNVDQIVIFDKCGICGGDDTVCAGCDGVPNSGKEIDICGVCGGNGNESGYCQPEDCTDGNESGYCQDLGVLQNFIDNSSGTLNMTMDENGNGMIDPLELGNQIWVNGRLTSLTCVSVGLSGQIPESIGSLIYLHTLSLINNELSGDIPESIGNLANLQVLYLRMNELAGSMPESFSNLSKLFNIDLSSAGGQFALTGNIFELFEQMEDLSTLFRIDLRSNHFYGEIPENISSWTNLTYLQLDNNQFTGEISESITSLTNLSVLSLHNNLFTGNISGNICDLANLSWSLEGGYYNSNVFNNNLCPPYPSCIEDYVGEQDTSECPETVTDFDGNDYEIVQIGDQIWMAENLKTTHYNNGDEILTGTNWGIYGAGAYIERYIFGSLRYNWYAVDDDRGLCMDGWHVPTSNEWNILTYFLGGDAVAGGKMKSTGTIEGGDGLWNYPNEGATNESGFTGLPAGYIDSNGIEWHVSEFGSFWSSSSSDDPLAKGRDLIYSLSGIYSNVFNKLTGFSIRCLRD